MALKVLFVVPYPLDHAPGQRFRFEQWLGLLRPGSIDATVHALMTPAEYWLWMREGATSRKAWATARGAARRLLDVVQAGRWDVAFVYREALPVGGAWVERQLSTRLPVVYDFDDAIFLGATSDANQRWARWKRPEKVRDIVACATTVTVGNSWLADYVRQFSDRVEVLPTTLDVDRFRPPTERREGPIRVGWSGSPTTASHLHTIDSALRRMLDELPVELLVIGDERFTLPGADRVEARAWERSREMETLGRIDIGLMPLPDDAWSRGKCGFKALQYMALAVPTVASPVGVNTEIIEDAQTGLLARSDDDWFGAVARLVEDEGSRRTIGAAGRQTVVDRYSGQEWCHRFLRVLESAAGGRG